MLHTPQRHLVGYNANDHVASTSSFPLRLAMIPRFGVSQVSLFPHIQSGAQGDEREGWDSTLDGFCVPR